MAGAFTPSCDIEATMTGLTETQSAFLKEAAELLGTRGLTCDPDALSPWLTDWRGRYSGRAFALAAPASTAEVAQLVKLCARYAIPIVPQGGNSGMAGGATPDASGTAILLSLRRMNTIRSFDAGAGQCICEAGVILQTLHEAAEEADMRFPARVRRRSAGWFRQMLAARRSCATERCARRCWESRRCSPMAACSMASRC